MIAYVDIPKVFLYAISMISLLYSVFLSYYRLSKYNNITFITNLPLYLISLKTDDCLSVKLKLTLNSIT